MNQLFRAWTACIAGILLCSMGAAGQDARSARRVPEAGRAATAVLDPAESAAVRIAVAGVTNSITTAEARRNGYLAVVFLLDPANVHGEAPPYEGLSDKGSQLWYGVLAPARQTVERLELVDHDQDGRREVSLWTSTGHIFYVSLEGKVMGRSASDGATGDSAFLLVEERPGR